jgi:hypothetical protein
MEPMIDCFRLRRLDRVDFIVFSRGAIRMLSRHAASVKPLSESRQLASTPCARLHGRTHDATSSNWSADRFHNARRQRQTSRNPETGHTTTLIDLADLLGWGERRGLSLVGLLATGADEIFHSFRRLGALSLLEFIDPVGDGIHHVMRRFAGNFGLAFLPVHALSAFDDFYFLLRHKLLKETTCNQDKRINCWKVPT